FVRTRIEVANDDPLHQHAEDRDEQGADDNRYDERSGIGVGHPSGVTAEHEHRAMREVQDAERAVDDGEPRRDQREQCAEYQPIEALRDEIAPIDHKFSSSPRSSRPGFPGHTGHPSKQDVMPGIKPGMTD